MELNDAEFFILLVVVDIVEKGFQSRNLWIVIDVDEKLNDVRNLFKNRGNSLPARLSTFLSCHNMEPFFIQLLSLFHDAPHKI